MDPSLHLQNQSMDEFSNTELGKGPESDITYPNQELVNGHAFQEQIIEGAHLPENGTISASFVDIEDDNHNDRDLSDGISRFIDKILMEEDMEDNAHMLQESSDLQAKERSFYEVLGKKYPPSPQQESPSPVYVVDPICCHTRADYISPNSTNICSSNGLNSVVDRLSDSPVSHPQIDDMYSVSEAVRNFMQGVDDARKFLPSGSKLLDMNSLLVQNSKAENTVDNDEARIKSSRFEARGKKNQHPEENDCGEERSNKLPVVDTESNVPTEEFDDVWIYTLAGREKKLAAYIADLVIAGSKTMHQGGQAEESSGAKGRCKKNKKEHVIDLTSLLIECAESVSAGDHHTANELLKKIRQHSSPFGNGRQRLAHYFADGLEARLVGSGGEIYKALVHERVKISDYLKAYCMILTSSSFRKISDFASNKLIMIKSEKAMSIHIIDFGINLGFQWPIFIRRVAEREGGPPKLRITGIDFPQSGSQPAERIEDTGRRLAHYAKMFNMPFEYNAIAQDWETIKIEDLKIEKGNFVAVTCSFRTKSLTESSRTTVLDLIRKMNPDIFIHGIVNGAYSGPFFVPRFLEVLSHYSAVFDMIETIIPGDKPERMFIERTNFGKEILNVIACEDHERVERPETYRQWQKRHLRAGFMQVPFGRKVMDTIMYKIRNFYHRDFVINEMNHWLLMSWKGKIIYAISCWQPV